MDSAANVSHVERDDIAQAEPQAARGSPPVVMRALLRLSPAILLNIVAAPAFAGPGGDMHPEDILNEVLKVMTGTLGTALAALGIIACGLMWMFGRASVGLIAGVIGGIMIVFSSAYIANQLVGAG